MRLIRELAARITAAVILLTILIGTPIAIVALIGTPYPSWDRLTEETRHGQLTNDTTMRIAALIGLILWILAVISIANETRHALAARQPTSSPVNTPTAVAAVAAVATIAATRRGILAKLVRVALLGTVSTAVTISSFATTAIAHTTPASSTHTVPAAAVDTTTGTSPPTWVDDTRSPTRVIVSTGRETPLSIATDLGDETLRDRIIELNTRHAWTGGVFPTGMDIHVPISTTPDVGDHAAVEAATTYVVQPGDGMWNVAEALLGDGSRHHELRQLLDGQHVAPGVIFTVDTPTIHPGWTFTMPATTPIEHDPNTASDTASDTEHIVRPNETLWSIAGDELGDSTRWPEIWEVNADRDMNDGRSLTNPDLIQPGWELDLPTVDTDQQTPTATEQPAPTPTDTTDPETSLDAPVAHNDATESSPPTGPPTSPPVSEDDGADIAVPVDAQRSLPPRTVAPRSAENPPTPSARPEMSTPIDPIESIHDIDDIDPIGDVEGVEDLGNDWQRSVWVQIAAGSLLLAGLATMVRRLRLRRLARLEPGQRLVDPPSVASGTELAISRTTESMREISTLRGLLQSITPYANEQTDPPAVRAVQLGQERIEVLFATPAPLPPKGWATVDGGQSWTHRFTDQPVSSRQLLTPALVTIGIRRDDHGDDVLVDLETAASVSISGDHEAAMGLARSMALELATYPLGVPMDLRLIGLHVDGTETCDRVWLDTTLQRAVRVTRDRLESNGVQGAASMVAARAALDEDDGTHDPVVFIVNTQAVNPTDRALLDELIDITHPSTGVAVVLVGEHPNAHEHIIIDNNSHAVWSHVELAAPNVTLEAAAEAAVMLDHAANADSEPMEPGELMIALLDHTDAADHPGVGRDNDSENRIMSSHVHDAAAETEADPVLDYQYVPPTYDILLQTMGSVTTHGIDLTANEIELLCFMACLRGHTEIHVDLIHDAIAATSIRKTVENRISKLRVRLGVGSDGDDLLPAASSTGRGTNANYRLSNLVLTDVDLLEHRLHTAHTLGSTDALRVLRDGLDLMHGPLFRVRKGFDGWPHSEGIVVAMTSVITNYARCLIDLAVEVDDIALVVRTTAAAGRVLDNPVAEFPFRQVEEEYAEACGNEELLASVEAARRKLLAYLHNDDSLAEP